MQRKTNTLLAVLGSSLVGILFSTNLCVSSVSAYSASIATSGSVSLDVSAATDTSIKSDSINVVSDCRAGYNLTIATPNGSDLYKYDNDTQANTATFTAVDGTSALNSSSNTNKWGYTLTANPTDSTVFNPLSSTSSTLKTPSQTASPSADINDTFNIYYGIRAESTIDPGTYKMATVDNNVGSVVYYLTMDTTCTQYTISFDPNGGTVDIGSNNPTQFAQAGESTKLISADTLTAPTTTDYTDAGNNTITGITDKLWTFWGWNTAIDGTGDWYKDRELVEDLATAGSTITLYAQWKQATLADLTTGTQVSTEKVIDHNTMQDMSPEACYNSDKFTAIGTPYGQATLTDNRDGTTRTYTVAKLPDNSCWMTQNLNLGASTDITLTSEDTDITTDFILPASDSSSFSTSSTAANYNKATVLNNMIIPDYTVNSTTYSGKVNAYYSYAAATANTNTYSTSGSTIFTTSICPKDWDLPTVAQYYNLRTKGSIATYNNTNASYAGKNAGNEPYHFIYGGYRKAAGDTINTSYFNNPTSYGYLWTANNNSTSQAKGSYVYSSGIYNSSTGANYNKYYGLSLRCVASNGTATINYDGNGTNEYPTTGTTASQTNVEINSTNTSANGFTRNGWIFNGWNTQADGSGINITATNASTTSLLSLGLAPGSTLTLYAQWLPQYTITYINNCITYASANSACTQSVSDESSEQKINLANNPSTGTETGTLEAYNKFTLTGWKIIGWSTVADNSSSTNTEYEVSSTYTVPSGSSEGDGITLYAHWVPVYSIQYDGNNADNPNGMGTTDSSTGVKSVKQANVSEGDIVTLLAPNFKRAGYSLAGWSTNSNATITSGDKIYGPMETISAPAYPNNGTNIITMYAVWIPAEKDGNNNPIYLQDFTTSDCNALTSATFNTSTGTITPGSVIALTDKRDNQVYTVAKLVDNNCWMVDNLRLDNQYTMGQNQNDSSVTNESLAQGYDGTPGVYGSFVGLADSESTDYSRYGAVLNSVYKSSADPPVDTYDPSNNMLEDIGTANGPIFRIPRYNNDNTAKLVDSTTYTQDFADISSDPVDIGTNYRTSSSLYSYGNHYTWAAAMASTNYFADSSTSETVNTSLCPRNWHLPSSKGVAKEFGALAQGYGGSGGKEDDEEIISVLAKRFRTFPNNFLYSGFRMGSSLLNRGTNSYYWSRTADSNGADSYFFHLSRLKGYYNPSGDGSRYQGFSIRCMINS